MGRDDDTEGDVVTDETIAEVREQVESQVLWFTDTEFELRAALDRFSHELFDFADAGEWNLNLYTVQFLWCCHAIRWGVARYDEYKQGEQAAA